MNRYVTSQHAILWELPIDAFDDHIKDLGDECDRDSAFGKAYFKAYNVFNAHGVSEAQVSAY